MPDKAQPFDSRDEAALAAQFPLRWLFVVVAVAAVLLALVGPYYRNWNAAQRTEFLVTWLSAIPVVVAYYAGWVLPRRKLQSRAGELWLRLEQRQRMQRLWQGCIVVYLLLLFTLSWPSGPLSWPVGGARSLWMPALRGLTWGCQIGCFTPILMLRTLSPELREKGIVCAGLIAWSSIQECRWSAHNPNQLALRSLQPKSVTMIAVPIHLRTRVVEIFKRQAPANTASTL